MNSFLLTVAGFLIFVLSSAFAVPHLVDWASYRYIFEAQATKLVGRTVGVGGDVRLSLLPTPVLRFEGVEVADAKGSFERPFAKAKSLTIWLSVPPLLGGTLEAREIEIEKPVLNLSVGEEGRGNWHDIGSTGAVLPFAPKEVALDEVNIVDASITLRRGRGVEPWTVEGLTGVLSAKSLDGPFKFAGTFRSDDVEREIRFSTTRREDDGSVRLKGRVRGEAGDTSYTVDGSLTGFADTPRFEGKLLAQFASDGVLLRSGTKGAQIPVEIKSDITTTLRGASFEGLEVTVRRKDRPQTIKGRVSATWHDGLRLDAQVGTRWFNFDPILSRGETAPSRPAAAVAMIAEQVLKEAAQFRAGRLRLSIDQAILAGDIVNDLAVDMSVAPDGVDLARLSARLPGDNDLSLQGRLRREDEGPAFQGDVALQGRKLSRLLRWSGWEGEALPGTAEAADFSLRADLAASPLELLIEKATGTALGTAFTGTLRYETGQRREFVLELDSDRVDMVQLFGPAATPGSLVRWAIGDGGEDAHKPRPGDASAARQEGAGWLETMAAQLDLRVGALVLPNVGDVALDAKLHLAKGDLSIRRLNLSSATGLAIRAEGALGGLGSRPDGKLTMSVDGPERESLRALAALLDIPGEKIGEHQLAALSPMRIVVAIESHRDNEKLLEARIGGTLAASNVSLTGRYEGELSDFETARLGLRGTVSNQDGRALMGQLFSNMTPELLERLAGERGVLTIALDGQVSSSLGTRVSLDAGGFNLVVDGKTQWQEEEVEVAGRTAFRAQDAAAALVLVGADFGPRFGPQPVELRAELAKTGGVYELTEVEGQIAGEPVKGRLRVDLTNALPRIEAAVTVSRSSLAAVLAPAIDWHRDVAGEAAQGQVKSYWPEKSFDTELLASVEGQIALSAARLELVGALVLDDARLDAQLADGTLEIRTLKGSLFDGAFAASGKLARRGANVGLVGKVVAKGVRLERVTGLHREAPLAKGAMDVEFALAGEGLTPSGLAAGLTGQGELRLAGGALSGLSPEVLKRFVNEADTSEDNEKRQPRRIKARVATELRDAEFRFRKVETAFAIRNGTVTLPDVVLENEDGQAKVTSYLELNGLTVDSEWVLQAPGEVERQIEPRITMVFAGPLTDFGRLAPEIDTQSLERYITMRRMERDVERLEKLEVPRPNGPSGAPERDGVTSAAPGGAEPQGSAPVERAPRGGVRRLEGAAPQGGTPADEQAAVSPPSPGTTAPAALRVAPVREEPAAAAPVRDTQTHVRTAPTPDRTAAGRTAPVTEAPPAPSGTPALAPPLPITPPAPGDGTAAVSPPGPAPGLPDQAARVDGDGTPQPAAPLPAPGAGEAALPDAAAIDAEQQAERADEPAPPRGPFNVLDLLREFSN